MITGVEWTQDALRELTVWIAGFTRDEIDLRSFRRTLLDDVEQTLVESDGRPETSYSLSTPAGEATVWEYVARVLWLVYRREVRPTPFWRRLLGQRYREIIIVAAMRRPPTLPELESLHR